MKIKLDENLPLQLLSILSDLRHDVHSVFQEGLEGRTTVRFGTRRSGKNDS